MNSKEKLDKITAPTLILSGDLDICYSIKDVKATVEGIPNSELKIYKGFDHNLLRKNRKEVKNDVLNFLKKPSVILTRIKTI